MNYPRANNNKQNFLSDLPEELKGGDSDETPESEWAYGFDLKPIKPSHNCVLVVDDDPVQLKMLQKIIEKAGYQVMTSDSAAEALDMLAEKEFNVIISDYKMPEMNGFEFLQAIRGLEGNWSTSDIPVIMLTACGDDLEFSALERGADMFCEKYRANSLLVKQIRFLLEM